MIYVGTRKQLLASLDETVERARNGKESKTIGAICQEAALQIRQLSKEQADD